MNSQDCPVSIYDVASNHAREPRKKDSSFDAVFARLNFVPTDWS